jgi:photosynthetic reaction center H subunit
MNLELTRGIDVALLVFYAFVLFFIALIFYLRREDRREGYPLEDTVTGRVDSPGGPLSQATPKTFRLPHGLGFSTTPTKGREAVDIAARRTDRFPGAPYAPTGDPLADGIGPAAWADRAKRPDVDMEGHPRIAPLSTLSDFFVARGDPSLVGWPVYGADGAKAGVIADLWVDRAERLVRYLQINAEGIAGRPVLAPMTMAKVDRRRGHVVIDALNAAQFAGAPVPAESNTITLYEEERIVAYFGGGYLYANASRQEPYL